MNFCIRKCCLLQNTICEIKNSFKLMSRKLCSSSLSLPSNKSDLKSALFASEQKKQLESVGRIEKIVVTVQTPGEEAVLQMNKDISTPFDCAKHVSQKPMLFSPMSVLDSDKLWEMHRPLTSNCTLKYLYFDDEDPRVLHNIFWESCSFILGGVIKSAFKDNIKVFLHGYPKPDYRTGSFVYDAQLSLNDWKPTLEELRVLTSEMVSFKNRNLQFERLTVSKELALEIMEDNPFKKIQVDKVASESGGVVTLYRIGEHIDVSEGPLISNTSLLNLVEITAVYKVKSNIENLYRFQGVALPAPCLLNHFAFTVLIRRAAELNPQPFPEMVS